MEWYHVWWPWLTSKRVSRFVSNSWDSCEVYHSRLHMLSSVTCFIFCFSLLFITWMISSNEFTGSLYLFTGCGIIRCVILIQQFFHICSPFFLHLIIFYQHKGLREELSDAWQWDLAYESRAWIALKWVWSDGCVGLSWMKGRKVKNSENS